MRLRRNRDVRHTEKNVCESSGRLSGRPTSRAMSAVIHIPPSLSSLFHLFHYFPEPIVKSVHGSGPTKTPNNDNART